MTAETLMQARALRVRLQGDLVLAGDESWDEARQAWNLAVDQRPAAVALPETVDDVVAIVDFAREHGLRVAPQGTGHNAGPLGWLDETILLKTSRMRRVDVDPESRRARVEAGVLWMEVTEVIAADDESKQVAQQQDRPALADQVERARHRTVADVVGFRHGESIAA